MKWLSQPRETLSQRQRKAGLARQSRPGPRAVCGVLPASVLQMLNLRITIVTFKRRGVHLSLKLWLEALPGLGVSRSRWTADREAGHPVCSGFYGRKPGVLNNFRTSAFHMRSASSTGLQPTNPGVSLYGGSQ